MEITAIATIVFVLGSVAAVALAHKLVGFRAREEEVDAHAGAYELPIGDREIDPGGFAALHHEVIELRTRDLELQAEVRQLRRALLQLRAEVNESHRDSEESRRRDKELERSRRPAREDRPLVSVPY